MERTARQVAGLERLGTPGSRAAVRLGGSGLRRRVDSDQRPGRSLETQSFRRLGALPRRPMAVVRRAGLRVDRERAVGLAALPLRPVDRTERTRLGVDPWQERGVQTG